jgi:membrane protein YdbS with pleckstrin-like domain
VRQAGGCPAPAGTGAGLLVKVPAARLAAIPPNHRAGAATGHPSRNGVCPFVNAASRTESEVLRQIVQGGPFRAAAEGARRRPALAFSGMPFPQKLLNDGERVVVDVRPHVWVMAWPVLIAAVVVAGSAAAAIVGVPVAVSWALVGLLVLALAYLLVRYVRWRATRLIVTNQRYIRRSGVISRSGREIPLSQLADISYHQNLFDRIIKAGDLTLESAGRESDEVFDSVPHPLTVQNEIYKLISARQPATMTVEPGLSLPEQLEKLDGLRHSGAISQDEFNSAKARLLER